MLAVGLMSGTSLDGVDAALVDISGSEKSTKVKLLGSQTTTMPEEIKDEIIRVLDSTQGSVDLICSLNFKLGELFAQAARQVCQDNGVPIESLGYIASHGQTIWHIPRPSQTERRSTLQIGEPAVIAYNTGVTVISGFRTMDMAAGGNGAPLVPYSEYILYGSKTESIALLNIGGIANITILPADCGLEDIYAFDTGPGNMVIDEVMKDLYGQKYDNNGRTAASGKISAELLSELSQHGYISLGIPKTTGREAFGAAFTSSLLEKWKGRIPSEDIVATVTRFTALCIGEAFRRHILTRTCIQSLIVSGGGVHNSTLMSYLIEELPEIQIRSQEDIGYSSDAKEAVAFAVLGYETLNRRPSNVPGATGASRPVILGNITYPPFKTENI